MLEFSDMTAQIGRSILTLYDSLAVITSISSLGLKNDNCTRYHLLDGGCYCNIVLFFNFFFFFFLLSKSITWADVNKQKSFNTIKGTGKVVGRERHTL